jgi:hypothetical protein
MDADQGPGAMSDPLLDRQAFGFSLSSSQIPSTVFMEDLWARQTPLPQSVCCCPATWASARAVPLSGTLFRLPGNPVPTVTTPPSPP